MVSLEFFVDIRSHYGPTFDSASNKNEYQEYFLAGGIGKDSLCVGLTTLPPSCADCFEIWNPNGDVSLRIASGIHTLGARWEGVVNFIIPPIDLLTYYNNVWNWIPLPRFCYSINF
jgi:hypothetical protein